MHIEIEEKGQWFFLSPSLLCSLCAVGLLVVDITGLVVSSLFVVGSVGRADTEK